MMLILIRLEEEKSLEKKLDEFFKLVDNQDFLAVFIDKPNFLRKQEIESLITKKIQPCDLLDMRVITCDVGASELVAMVFSSIKANRLIFQSAQTVEDIKSLLKLQIVNKKYTYFEL